MGQLQNWDFADEKLNSSLQLVNRQKSALRVHKVDLDTVHRQGVFFDGNNGTVKTSLNECECHDFNFIGLGARKKFQPCVHIYRLAIELGMMEAKHVDSKMKWEALTSEEKRAKEAEILRALPREDALWGGWNAKVHKHWTQTQRQHSAHEILERNDSVIDPVEKQGDISGYLTTLDSCTCPDHAERKLPCKHIYCLALSLGIVLHITPEQYRERRDYVRDNLTPIISIRYNDGEFEIKKHVPE